MKNYYLRQFGQYLVKTGYVPEMTNDIKKAGVFTEEEVQDITSQFQTKELEPVEIKELLKPNFKNTKGMKKPDFKN